MSFLEKSLPSDSLVLLANDNTIVLYENANSRLTAKLTIQTKESAEKLIQLIKKHPSSGITLILDPKKDVTKIISFPDIGLINTKKKLNEILKNTSSDIIYPITISAPTETDHTRKFLITKANLSAKIIEFITLLTQHNILIESVYLLYSGHINLCKKIQKSIIEKTATPKNSYFIIYLQNSNGELCEFTLKDNNLINYHSEEVDESQICAKTLERFTKNKKKLIFQKVPESNIHLVTVFPEPFRGDIKTDKHHIFLSVRDISTLLLKRKTSGSCSYSSVLTEISFFKHKALPIKIGVIKKLSFLEKIYKLLPITFACITIGIFSMISYYLLSSRNIQIHIKELSTQMAQLNSNFEQLKIVNTSKKILLQNDPELNDLYCIIHTNPYSLDIMTKLDKANIDRLPVEKFTYTSTSDLSGDYTISLVIAQQEQNSTTYFNQVDKLVHNLKSEFPSEEIDTYRENSNINSPISIHLASKKK